MPVDSEIDWISNLSIRVRCEFGGPQFVEPDTPYWLSCFLGKDEAEPSRDSVSFRLLPRS
jgi:hypothetical protein